MSPSVALDVTDHAKPPRFLFVPFRMGHQFGVPFHRELQSEVIMACLELLSESSGSHAMGRFPKTWAEARREGKAIDHGLAGG